MRTARNALVILAMLAAVWPALAAPAQASGTANHTEGRTALNQASSALESGRDAGFREAGCPRGPSTYDIGIGATGTAVREVQCLLNATLSYSAYPYIPVNGSYDSFTAGGVQVFQTCANYRHAGIGVDGRVGPQTLPHLRWWGQHTHDTGEVMC
ncbi:peptidoglycan-binding domain-containing protein [Amycolatopsis sp. NPDC051716]|jgi:peptidoglycan hydrolase-like protein with peptidoglycan-binding domain|uniref:peptidoglycan-binding domain-containing protein n=1 Tax=Amycolatopsis sp. NPDC051716 TaxID=3155804 RepID=UPI00343388FF